MTTNDIWLIAGLGNPEAKYEGTRHNAGFAALDYLAGKWGISVSKSKFQGLWGQGEVDGRKVCLLKPLTYMNLSGDSIAPWPPFSRSRPITSSSCATTSPRPPASCASGLPGRQGATTASRASLPGWGPTRSPASASGWAKSPAPTTTWPDWVLGRFPEEDAKAVSGRWPDIEAAARLLMAGKLSEAQNKYNR